MIVFIDISNSSGLYKYFGINKTTEMITAYIDPVVDFANNNHVQHIKKLGDGVLLVFPAMPNSLTTLIELRRLIQHTSEQDDELEHILFRTGATVGTLQFHRDECFGEAVNTAARLCDVCTPGQIWIDSTLVEQAATDDASNYLFIGDFFIKGKAEQIAVYKIHWQKEASSTLLQYTVSPRNPLSVHHIQEKIIGLIEHEGKEFSLKSKDFPITIGRSSQSHILIEQVTASRNHLVLHCEGECIIVSDISTYGSLIFFHGSLKKTLKLHRHECVLFGDGFITLGPNNHPNLAILKFSIL